jgi:protoheme IX farnesyltransferase
VKTLRTIHALCRIPLSLFAACSAAAGYFLDPQHRAGGVAVPAAAVFLLSCGASALNQYQERDIDSRMERTRHRPLPSGTLAPRTALVLAAGVVTAGLGLSAACGTVPVLLGITALIWYNGFYTWLKRRTAFAAVYGAPVGMLPPAIGWTAGGGSITDPRLFAIAMVFFLWQVPHFWLLLLRSKDDYERAGLPSLSRVFSPVQVARLTTFWITAAASAAVLLPLYGIVRSATGCLALGIASFLLVIVSLRLPRRPESAPVNFAAMNVFLAAVMLVASADSLLRGSW